jgi:HEPN domain-containing protein
MSGSDPTLPESWFAHGDQDLQSAEILLAHDGSLAIAGFHLQQAIEKYLKGFLLAKGHTPRRIHDLEVLLQEASAYDTTLNNYLDVCQRITEYYIESRYPIGAVSPLNLSTLEEELESTQSICAYIRARV